jgi:caffeoyl-CoA O-methyltransferase
VGPYDGRHLEVLARASGARRMIEIGTLGGYSGVCLARALPPDGVLHTFELDPHHAEVARDSFARADLADRIRIHVGPALETLGGVETEGPFDLAFIDADKERYPRYLDWIEAHLRVGGLLLADNVFRKPREREWGDEIHAFNTRLADSGRWRTTLLPIEDGLAVAVRLDA